MRRDFTKAVKREALTAPVHNGPLYISDEKLAERLGVELDTLRVAIRWFEGERAKRRGMPFPRTDPLFEDKRFLPAVVAFLHARHGVSISDTLHGIVPDGAERWNETQEADTREAGQDRRRPRSGMAAAR